MNKDLIVIKTKHFDIELKGPFVFDENNKLNFDYSYTSKTSYATTFKVKKYIKKFIISAIIKGIESSGDTFKRRRKTTSISRNKKR